jgi:hypothetical protein
MTNLTDELQRLAEADAPPMKLDIELARATGRRYRRRRSTTVAGVAALAVTGTLVVANLVTSVENRPAPATSATPRPVVAPLVTHATFGWLPPGITRTDFEWGEHGDHVRAQNEKADLGTQLWLTVYPAGKIPDVELGGQKRGAIPADPVNGRTAYWVTADSDPRNGGDAVLLWQAADGRWAQLHGYYLHLFADPKAVLHRIATETAIGDRAQPLPVRITGLPRHYRIYDVTFARPMRRVEGSGRWDLALFYRYNGANFSIHAFPAGTKRNKYGAKACRIAKAVEVCVITEFTRHKAIRDLGGPQGILDHFVPLGMDESRWETGQR